MNSYSSSATKKPKRLINVAKWHPNSRKIANAIVIFFSVILCLLILPTRLPGMELLGMGPNWLLIWVVAWSVKRSAWSGALAGITLGLIQDGMTSSYPSHAIGLAVIGILTALLKKQRYMEEDFISVALIVFGMALISESVLALQFISMGLRPMAEVWTDHQKIALTSAILSSLWAPVLYYPLNRWWANLNLLETAKN
ncbi:MAG TPA: rod shape-determining protein MreD [Leptolyngbyaceae cyanobacterium]